jgi:hypothetical protein
MINGKVNAIGNIQQAGFAAPGVFVPAPPEDRYSFLHAWE